MDGRLEIPNLSSSVEKYFTRRFEREEKKKEKRNFVYPQPCHILYLFTL